MPYLTDPTRFSYEPTDPEMDVKAYTYFFSTILSPRQKFTALILLDGVRSPATSGPKPRYFDDDARAASVQGVHQPRFSKPNSNGRSVHAIS